MVIAPLGPRARAPRGYVIPDEPAPGRLSVVAVTPFATFLGLMLGGAIVGLPWMVLNGFAIGSATRRRELLLAIGTLVGMFGVMAAVFALLDGRYAPAAAAPYLGLMIHGVRLVGAYTIYMTQEKSFELYLHFGGRVSRYGWVLAIGLFVVRLAVISALGSGMLSTALLF